MSNTFSNIDKNQPASAKQLWAVANHFASLESDDSSEQYGLKKVFNAILNAAHADKSYTHGQIQKFFELSEVPKAVKSKVQAKAKAKPKKAKKKPAAKKATAKPKASKAKAKATVKADDNPTPSGAAVHFANNSEAVNKLSVEVDSLNHRMNALDGKVDDIQAGLALILETISEKK